MDELKPIDENIPARQPATHRRKRHRKHSRKKNKLSTQIIKWMKKNPMRVIAILCGLVLIYITILFILYSSKEKKPAKKSLVHIHITTPSNLQEEKIILI